MRNKVAVFYFPLPFCHLLSYFLVNSIDLSDPYHGQGTTYLHVTDDRRGGGDSNENPTGAVVVPISMSTTFRQSVPGQATAVDDPNSFGMGYEYSRTGMF